MRIRELWCAIIYFGHKPGPSEWLVGGRNVHRCIHCGKILSEETITNAPAERRRLGIRSRRW